VRHTRAGAVGGCSCVSRCCCSCACVVQLCSGCCRQWPGSWAPCCVVFLYFSGCCCGRSPRHQHRLQYLHQPPAGAGSDVSGGIGFLGQNFVFAELVFPRRQSTCLGQERDSLRACVSSSPSGAHGEGTGEGRVRVRSVSTSSGAPAIARVIFRRDRQRDRPTTRVSFRRGKLGTRRRPRDDRDLPQTPIPRGPARSDSNCNGDVRRDGGKRHGKNTGLFCVHLLRTFIHIQIDKIPAKYIFKRYTKSARRDVAFSREDKILTGDDGNTKKL